MVLDGKFDAEIIAVQALVKETKAKKAASVTVPFLAEAVQVVEQTSATPILDSIKSHTNTPPNIDGLDLSSID